MTRTNPVYRKQGRTGERICLHPGLIQIIFHCFMVFSTLTVLIEPVIEASDEPDPRTIHDVFIDKSINWWSQKWWLIEDRFNFYLNDIRLNRDKILLNTIIGDQNELHSKTHYNIKTLRNDFYYYFDQIFFTYYPEHSLSTRFGAHADIDPYYSYPYSMGFEGSKATNIREDLQSMVQSDLGTEALIDIAAYLISYANDFQTDWLTVRDVIVRAEWGIALGLSAFLYSQNEINMGLVMPLYRSADNERWAGIVNFRGYGLSQKPRLECGIAYETSKYTTRFLLRQRFGDAEIYENMKRTLQLQVDADLLTRTMFEKYFKVQGRFLIERSIDSDTPHKATQGEDGVFYLLHDYSLKLSVYRKISKVAREYSLRFRFLDLHTNTISLLVPALVFERKSGYMPLIYSPLSVRVFFEGGYGTPFTLEDDDDFERDLHFFSGINLNW
ncbi:hypothetical protein JXQ70_11150 [bacterium]|nr:hypothetical protein [bacterium]